VADVEYADVATGDREERPVDAVSAPVEDLANFGLNGVVLGSESAALGGFRERVQGKDGPVEQRAAVSRARS
jgi:hypothetical protein